jgi:hypothetical protein
MGDFFEACDRQRAFLVGGDLRELAQVGVGQRQEVPALELVERAQDRLHAPKGLVAASVDQSATDDREPAGFEVQQSCLGREELFEVRWLEPVQDRIFWADADLQCRVAVEKALVVGVFEGVVVRERQPRFEQRGLVLEATGVGFVEALSADDQLPLREDRSRRSVAEGQEPPAEIVRVFRI